MVFKNMQIHLIVRKEFKKSEKRKIWILKQDEARIACDHIFAAGSPLMSPIPSTPILRSSITPGARLDVAAWVVWCNIFIIRNKDKYLKLNIEHETLAVRLAACASLTIKPKGP